jgi:hypothetical protein
VLTELNNLITTGGMTNYQTYRELLKSLLKQVSVPILPYMGVHLLDLQLMDENNNDYMPSEFNVELINWSKRETMYDIIADIQHMQTRNYVFMPVHQIQKILTNMRERIDSPKDLVKMSWQAEPPGISPVKKN